ncbi:cytochrome c oxidase subunit 1 [Chytriomyces hyalinus]|nr:cytochrome c oxidase subunit 1 [Chytriomyces hyalinus]
MSYPRDDPESKYTLREALSMLVPAPEESRASVAAKRPNKKKKGMFSLPPLPRSSANPSRSRSLSPSVTRPSSPIIISAPFNAVLLGEPSSASTSPARSSASSPSHSAFVSAPSSPLQHHTAPSNSLQVPDSPQPGLKLRKLPSQILEAPNEQPTQPEEPPPSPKEYRAIKEFKGANEGELPLEVGDIVEKMPRPNADMGPEWWYGISRTWGPNNGLVGYFLADHVVLETFEEVVPSPTVEHVQTPVPVPEEDGYIEEEVASELPATIRPGTKLVCLFPYERTKADELEMEAGDIIVVLDAPEGGWWRGMKGFSTKTPTSGWFPCSMVTIAPGENIPGWTPTQKVRRVSMALVAPPEQSAPTTEPEQTPVEDVKPQPASLERAPKKEGSSRDVTAQTPTAATFEEKPIISAENEVVSVWKVQTVEVNDVPGTATNSSATGTGTPEISAPVSRYTSRAPSRPVSSVSPFGVEGFSTLSSDNQSEKSAGTLQKGMLGVSAISPSSGPSSEFLHPEFSSRLAKDISNSNSHSVNLVPEDKPTVSEVAETDVNPNVDPPETQEGETVTELQGEGVHADAIDFSDSKSRSDLFPDDLISDVPTSLPAAPQSKSLLAKAARQLKTLSAPSAALIGNMSSKSLGPLLDEPEPMDSGDISTGAPTDTMSLLSNDTSSDTRSSGALLKNGVRNRSASMTEADKSLSRTSLIVGKSWLPQIEGSRASILAQVGDSDTASVAPSETAVAVPETAEVLEAKQKKRMNIIVELIGTERDYVRDLKIIIENFMKPMSNSKFDKNVDSLFSNVDELLSINSEFLRRFEAKQRASPEFTGVGEIFLELGESFAKYSLYCGNHSAALTKLQNLMQTNRAFRIFLEDICKNPVTRQLDLGGFLIKPVQRICKYPLLLKEIIKNTADDHRELPILKLALETIQAIITQVNDGARAAEGVRKMVEVQNMFTEKLSIITPTRYMLRDDTVNLIGKNFDKKARRLFLFNDLVIVSRKDWQSKLRLIHQINLRHCRVCDIVDDNNDSPSGHMFEVEVIPAGGNSASSKTRRFLFSADTAKAKTTWIEAYRGVATIAVKKKKFSETVVVAEDGEDDDGTGVSANIVDGAGDGADEILEEDKPVSIQKRLEQYREDSKKALMEEYKHQIQELSKKLDMAKNGQEETKKWYEDTKVKLIASEATVESLQKSLEDLKEQLWASQCQASESIALTETLQIKVADAEKLNSIHKLNSKAEVDEKVTEIVALQATIEEINISNATLLHEKDARMMEMREEFRQAMENEKKTAALEREQLLKDTESEMSRAVEDLNAKLRATIEDASNRISASKLSFETQLLQSNQAYELKILQLQEESRTKLAAADAALKQEQQVSRETIQEKATLIKELEKEHTIEKQRLATELETFKRKATAAHESMKRVLLETKNELKTVQATLKEKEGMLLDKDDSLREKVNLIGKLDLEKSALSSELSRTTAHTENMRLEHVRILGNLEKVIQERHQTISRKESEIAEMTQRLTQANEKGKHAEHDAEKLSLELHERTRHFEETVSQLREEMSKTRAERARESEQLETLNRTYRDAVKQLDELRSQLSGANDANRRLATENTKLTESLASQTSALTVATHDLQEIRLQFNDVQEKLRRKNHDFSEVATSDTTHREKLKALEEQYHKLIILSERSETRNVEFSKSLEQKDAEISDLKETLRKTAEQSQAQLHHELSELKKKLLEEASIRYQYVAKENAELQLKLNREMAEVKEKKEHDEQMLAGQLELVERLQKETMLAKTRCEAEIQDLKTTNERLDTESKEKAKQVSLLKRRLKNLEAEKESLEECLQAVSQKMRLSDEQNAKLVSSSRALEDELTLLKTRLSATEKESLTLTNRLELYSELDKKYLALREHSDQIHFDIKSKQGHMQQTEGVLEKREKEIAALRYALEEIWSLIVGIQITASAKQTHPIAAAHNTRILSGLGDESAVKAILSRIHDISVDHEQLCNSHTAEIQRSQSLKESLDALTQDRLEILSNLKKIESKFKEKARRYKTDVQDFEAMIESLKSEMADLKHQAKETEECLRESQTKLKAADSAKSDLETQLHSALATLETEPKQHAAVVENLHLEIQQLKARCEKFKTQSTTAALKITEMEGETEYLQQLTESLIQSKLSLESNADSAAQKISSMQIQLSRVGEELLQKTNTLQQVKETNELLDAKQKTLVEAINVQQTQYEDVIKNLQGKLQDIASNQRRKDSEAQQTLQTAISTRQAQIDACNCKIQQLEELLQDRDERISKQTTELQDLEERFNNARAENQVLCSEVVEVSRRENSLRNKLDTIQSKIVASSQTIDDLQLQHLHNSQYPEREFEERAARDAEQKYQQKYPLRGPPAVRAETTCIDDQTIASPPLIATPSHTKTSNTLIKSTLKMIDGILEKKTLILRKLVSCEKAILALLDINSTERGYFDGILDISISTSKPLHQPNETQFQNHQQQESQQKQQQNQLYHAQMQKETALRTLEYLANVSSSINHSQEGKTVMMHRARRDMTVAKELLFEMHEFVRIWLSGFEAVHLLGSSVQVPTQPPLPTLAQVNTFQEVYVDPFGDAGSGKGRSLLKHGAINSFSSPRARYLAASSIPSSDNSCKVEPIEEPLDPLAAKTPGILLALPEKLGKLFSSDELNNILGSFGEPSST